MVMDYWASTLLDYKSYIGMDVTISLTRQSVKLLWIYGHLSVGIYLSQRILLSGLRWLMLRGFPPLGDVQCPQLLNQTKFCRNQT